jgi:hypothetical protein
VNADQPYLDQSDEDESLYDLAPEWLMCLEAVAKLELTFEDAIRHLEADGSGEYSRAVRELRLFAANTRNEQDRMALSRGFLPLTAQEIAALREDQPF